MATGGDQVEIQSGAFLIELSPDWLVLRASENVHHLLGESHVTLIGKPLGSFVHSRPLHDLRNMFSRLSGTTGIARAFNVRLTDDPDLVDIAFQLSAGRVVLEAAPSVDLCRPCEFQSFERVRPWASFGSRTQNRAGRTWRFMPRPSCLRSSSRCSSKSISCGAAEEISCIVRKYMLTVSDG